MDPCEPMLIEDAECFLRRPTSIVPATTSSSPVVLKEFSQFPLTSLLPELILHVTSFLEARQLLNVSQCCKLLNEIYKYNMNYLWRVICERKWNFTASVTTRRAIDWLNYYFERTAINKEGSFSWTLMDETIKERPSPRMCHTGTSLNLPSVANNNNSSEKRSRRSFFSYESKSNNSTNSSTNSGNSVYNSIVYIGGQSGQTSRFDDIYLFDGQKFIRQNTLLKSSSNATTCDKPNSFARHTSVSIGNKIYSFGGFDGIDKYFGIAVLDLDNMTWTYPTTYGEAPKLKTNHAATAVGKKMYIFGGNRTEGGKYYIFDDLHVFDTETMTWSQPKTTGDAPSKRVAHKLLSIGSKIYLFGGGIWEPTKDWTERTKKIYILDTETMEWSCPRVNGEESVRVSSFTIPFVYSTFIFFFGGQSIQDGNEVNDFISFDTVSNTWSVHTPLAHKDNPGQRSVGTLNLAGEHAYLFAGSDSFDLSNSVHRLNHVIFKGRKTAKLQ